MNPTSAVLAALELARREGRLVERPHAAALPREAEGEKAFLARVQALAGSLGWLTYHTHDSRKSPPGFPDLVLVRDRVVFAELKTDAGRLTDEQQEWLDRLGAAGAEVYVWRPRDWRQVRAVLDRGC
jgi:VRR-NUC domain